MVGRVVGRDGWEGEGCCLVVDGGRTGWSGGWQDRMVGSMVGQDGRESARTRLGGW